MKSEAEIPRAKQAKGEEGKGRREEEGGRERGDEEGERKMKFKPDKQDNPHTGRCRPQVGILGSAVRKREGRLTDSDYYKDKTRSGRRPH